MDKTKEEIESLYRITKSLDEVKIYKKNERRQFWCLVLNALQVWFLFMIFLGVCWIANYLMLKL